MHIAVIGAGVVGVTTAQALQTRGHQVTVIESLEGAALETSRANAGQRSYGYVYPWASPAMIKKALPWLVKTSGPLKMQLPPTTDTMRFLLTTWRYARTPGLYEQNKRAMLRLGAYSRDCFIRMEQDLTLDFDGGHNGLMELASDDASLQAIKANARLLGEVGIEHHLLSADEARALEPGLKDNGPLVGAMHVPRDGTGDCHQFTRALAAHCQSRGVDFRFGTDVVGLTRGKGGSHVLALRAHGRGAVGSNGGGQGGGQGDGQGGILEADAIVLCAGAASPGLGELFQQKLPMYPVKGYSLTVPLLDTDLAPRSTVIDDRYKVVVTRLGGRIRATGFVELTGLNRDIPSARLATIREAVNSRFPGAADLRQAEPWTGFRPMTPDGPPIIGKGNGEGIYINTGHGTFGWTLSAASAELIAQVIDGETPATSLDAFSPERFH